MKRIFLIPLIILAVSAFVFGACAAPAPAPPPAEKIKLIVAEWEGPKGAGIPPLLAWIDELQKQSGGQVEVDVAYGSVMGKPPGTL